jgi:hypothetical protein
VSHNSAEPRVPHQVVLWRRRGQWVLLCLAVGMFLGLGERGYTEAQSGPPSVRLVHVSPGTPPINASLDGRSLTETLSYGAVSTSLPFPGGMARLRVYSSDNPSRVVLDTPVELPIDGPATILLVGVFGGTPSLNAIVLSDHLGQTSQDRTRLRFVNVAVGSDLISLINEAGVRLFENIGYGSMGDAVLDPGPLLVRAVSSGQQAAPVAELRLVAEPGRSYTAILAGQTRGEPSPKIILLDHSRVATARATSSGPSGAGTVLADETFSESATGILPGSSPAGATLTYGYADGEYWLRNAEVATQSLAVPLDAVNATIAVDARLIGDPSRRTVSVGCRFNSDSSGNRGYLLRVEPAAGLYRLVREDGTRDAFLRRDSASPAIRRGNDSNRIEITCAGNTITAAINGTVVTTVQDSTYASGSLVIGVGARASGLTSEARFDNLLITAR